MSCIRAFAGRLVSSGGDPLVTYGSYSSTALERGVSTKVGIDSSTNMKISFRTGGVTESQLTMASAAESTIRRFAMQSAARELMPREGVARCMRAGHPREDGTWGVDVLYAPMKAAAHFGGLQCCKSVWLCPVCAAKISERRRVELAEGLNAWLQFTTGERRRTLLVTFTLAHERSDDLSVVFGALKRARKLLVSGRAAMNFASDHGIAGMVRALELTHGLNGWHPHLHVLYFFNCEVPILTFEAAIKARWSACVGAAGRYASWQHGCDVRFSDSDISNYIAKWGKDPGWTTAHEMTKAVTKSGRRKGRTPMQLLVDYLAGDEAAGRLWVQYAVNFKGERQLRWSNGFRERLGLSKAKSDAQIALEQEEVAVILSSLTTGAWRIVLANDARGELLQVAAKGDPLAVEAFLTQLGVSAGSSYWNA